MKHFEKFYNYILLFVILSVYVYTLAPSVVQIDSGELATVQATLGIAHPTGYPLFTIIGYLFSLIPLPLSKIVILNLLAAIWSTLGIFYFAKTAKILIDLSNLNSPNKTLSDKTISTVFIIGASLILALSKTYWLQSGSVEVYSLQIFLFNLILWSVVKTYKQFTEKKKYSWLPTAFFLALGFANHMTTLLLLPGIAYLFFRTEGFEKQAWIKIGKMLGLFFPTLILFYLYLPLRASAEPVLNWGNPVNFENIWRHFTGKQYQVWLFTSIDAAKKQLSYFVTNLDNEFTYIGILLAALGIIYLLKKNKSLFTFIFTNFLFTIIYSINYDINDIDSYFLLAYINLAFFILFGFYFVLSKIKKVKQLSYAAISISLFTVIFIFINNFDEANQNDLYTFEDYTKEAIGKLPENSIVFSYQWDYLISPSYYFQYVENFRRDVILIDKELLRRSWYYKQLNNNYPNLLTGIKSETAGFVKALQPFERGEKYDARILERYYRSIMIGLIKTNIDNYDYYIAPEVIDNEFRRKEFSLPQGYTVAPDLFFFKVIKINEYYEAPLPEFNIRFPAVDNKYTKMLKNIIAGMLARRALYELNYNKTERAAIYVRKIKQAFPDYRIPVKLRKLL